MEDGRRVSYIGYRAKESGPAAGQRRDGKDDLEKFAASRNAKWEVWAKDRGMWEYLEAEYVEWLSGNIDAS